jgi:hypothetical protein
VKGEYAEYEAFKSLFPGRGIYKEVKIGRGSKADNEFKPDLIISDYMMPAFNCMQDMYYEALIDGTILEVSPSIVMLLLSHQTYNKKLLLEKISEFVRI